MVQLGGVECNSLIMKVFWWYYREFYLGFIFIARLVVKANALVFYAAHEMHSRGKP